MALPLDSASTILDCLEHYAKQQPEQRAYTFLPDGEDSERVLTWGELRSRSRRLAQRLHTLGLRDQAVLLLFPAGLEFVTGFFACLYAGAYAVPGNLARNSHHYMRLKQIIADARARVVLTNPNLRNSIANGLEMANDEVAILCESDLDETSELLADEDVQRDPARIAFLQYTSGSTGTPKGVMVTHGQLVANERAIRASCDQPEFLQVGGWLPQFHDMGLIGTMLQPAALGGHYVFMSPLHFVQRPLRWLHMLSRYKSYTTAAPNFALEMCLKANQPELEAQLDLSALRTIHCGAEPVNADAVRQFNARFAAVGLGADVVKPCYGLAEATLMVSGGLVPEVPKFLPVSREQLSLGKVVRVADDAADAQHLVCCGKSVPLHQTIIVDPENGQILPSGQVGEIWFAGPSVAGGYWERSQATEESFHARTACGQGPFMRTGDLGFIEQGGVFVTGRIKELMIVRGKNYYPHDIEATLIKAISQQRIVQAAVFFDESRENAGLVAYLELARRERSDWTAEFAQLCGMLRQTVSQEHDLLLKDVYLLTHGSIPKTSSGKTQRNRCAEMYRSGEIDADERVVCATRPLRNNNQ